MGERRIIHICNVPQTQCGVKRGTQLIFGLIFPRLLLPRECGDRLGRPQAPKHNPSYTGCGEEGASRCSSTVAWQLKVEVKRNLVGIAKEPGYIEERW